MTDIFASLICRPPRYTLQCHKRPTTVSKETYYGVKRDLLQCQKRPTTASHICRPPRYDLHIYTYFYIYTHTYIYVLVLTDIHASSSSYDMHASSERVMQCGVSARGAPATAVSRQSHASPTQRTQKRILLRLPYCHTEHAVVRVQKFAAPEPREQVVKVHLQ